MKLSLRGVSLAFQHRNATTPVLDEVSLEVRQREFVSVLGPSGCGKTTLLNALTGLTPLDHGQIVLDGNPVPHVRAQSGYMQQKDLLLPWRKALDNAVLGAQLQGRATQEIYHEARDLFRAFDLAGFEDYYPAQLSGGMRQRVALVRTLLTHRPLLLLDEPFGALDALTRMRLHDWLLKVFEHFGKTILMVTHDLDEALSLSDRIYVLTPRPARVSAEFVVDLPRPRDRVGQKFAGARRALWDQVNQVLSPRC